jgi:hypothetical protein
MTKIIVSSLNKDDPDGINFCFEDDSYFILNNDIVSQTKIEMGVFELNINDSVWEEEEFFNQKRKILSNKIYGEFSPSTSLEILLSIEEKTSSTISQKQAHLLANLIDANGGWNRSGLLVDQVISRGLASLIISEYQRF